MKTYKTKQVIKSLYQIKTRQLRVYLFCALGFPLFFLFTNCSDGFQSISSNSASTLDIDSLDLSTGRALYATNCANCHGAVDVSTKRGRTPLLIQDAIQAQQQMLPLVSLNSEQVRMISRALGGTTPNNSATNPFACQVGEEPFEVNSKRLSKVEYYNALQSLVARALGAAPASQLMTQLNLPSRIPADPLGVYSTSVTNFSVIQAAEYFNIADQISTNLAGGTNYARFVNTFIGYAPGACVVASVDTLNADCQNTLIRNFLLRAWGRPVEINAVNSNNELAAFQAEFAGTTSRVGVEAMIMRALISPQFLFHLYIDLRAPQGDNYQLSSHSIARRLSFIFTQTLPDEALLNMASTQDLGQDTAFLSAVNYLADRMDGTVQQFSREWLHLDQLPGYSETNHAKFQLISQGITADENLKTVMRNEVLELVSYLTRNNRNAKELLTSNISFARDPSLMRIYGQTTAAPATVNEQNAVRFPAGQRSGVLTRAAMLFSGNHTENPILRGVHFRNYLMCLTTPPPPGDLPAGSLGPPLPSLATTRDRYHNKTSGVACVGCHSQINPVGFAFSQYNAFGALQMVEPVYDANQLRIGDLPTNSIINLRTSLGVDQEVNGPVALSTAVAESSQFKKCITKNYFAYTNGMGSLPASDNSCGMNRMYQSLNNNSSLKDFFKNSVIDSRFRYRKLQR